MDGWIDWLEENLDLSVCWSIIIWLRLALMAMIWNHITAFCTKKIFVIKWPRKMDAGRFDGHGCQNRKFYSWSCSEQLTVSGAVERSRVRFQWNNRLWECVLERSCNDLLPYSLQFEIFLPRNERWQLLLCGWGCELHFLTDISTHLN